MLRLELVMLTAERVRVLRDAVNQLDAEVAAMKRAAIEQRRQKGRRDGL